MSKRSKLPPSFPALVQAYFGEYLTNQRALSPQTIATYRDGFVVFLAFAEEPLGRAPAAMVLADVTPELAVAKEEIFGPVAPLFRFKTEDEAVQMANDTEFGLAAYFYSKDHGRVWRVSKQLEYGMVGVNTGMISTEVAPFGGVKLSGVGREGSRHGLDEYMETKYLALGGL